MLFKAKINSRTHRIPAQFSTLLVKCLHIHWCDGWNWTREFHPFWQRVLKATLFVKGFLWATLFVKGYWTHPFCQGSQSSSAAWPNPGLQSWRCKSTKYFWLSFWQTLVALLPKLMLWPITDICPTKSSALCFVEELPAFCQGPIV